MESTNFVLLIDCVCKIAVCVLGLGQLIAFDECPYVNVCCVYLCHNTLIPLYIYVWVHTLKYNCKYFC